LTDQFPHPLASASRFPQTLSLAQSTCLALIPVLPSQIHLFEVFVMSNIHSRVPDVCLFLAGVGLWWGLIPQSVGAFHDGKRVLQVELRDDTTRDILAGRVYLEDEEGRHYFARPVDPAGQAVVYDVERTPQSREKHTTVSPHPFEFEVPEQATVTLTVERGKEYHVATLQVPPPADPTAIQRVEVPMRRWIDMAARGWYSGDTHVHRRLVDCPHLVEAEDLNVAFPLAYWVREARQTGDKGPVAGQPAPAVIWCGPRRCLWPVNTEYELFTVDGKPHTQGAVFVLNHREPPRLGTPPVAPVADWAHQSGALLDLDKHSWNWTVMIVPRMQVDLFELANNHVWRTNFLFRKWTIEMTPTNWGLEIGPEGVDEAGWIDWGFQTYYAFLNCGFRMRPTAGTGSGVHPVPLGFGRVYVEVPGDFTYEQWIEGLNAGRSFVTTGPMLFSRFNDHPAGTTVRDAQPGYRLRVQGTAANPRPLDRLEIVVNGEVVRTISPANTAGPRGEYVSPWDETIVLPHSAWVAVRCYDRGDDRRSRFAHTAPVHVEIDGPVRPRKREVQHFIERMEHEIQRNQGVLAPAELAEYEHALDIYRNLAKIARD
jgi:hypothetical protein